MDTTSRQRPSTGSEGVAPSGTRVDRDPNRRHTQVRAAETRLLYENACTGIVAALVVAALLAYSQWNVVGPSVVLLWLVYVVLISAARLTLVRRYLHQSPSDAENSGWRIAFAIGAALAAFGWGAAGFALYPEIRPTNEILLIFVLGGIMLGGASLLAARPEAFLTFLLPTGLLPAMRLASEGDREHM